MNRYLAVIALSLAASCASGHGIPLLVTTTDSGARLAPEFVPIGEFFGDGSEVTSFDPGVGVNFATTGPPAGTVLEVEVARGLFFWDGSALDDTEETLVVKAPSPAGSVVDEYSVTAASGPQSGMTWATYPGGNFWDSHGVFLLEPAPSGGSPRFGLYGLPLRLASPTLATSEPFVLPMLYGAMPQAEVQAGVAAFRTALAAGLPGDHDGDGFVDAVDYDAWSAGYGDGFDAVGYVVWREAAESERDRGS